MSKELRNRKPNRKYFNDDHSAEPLAKIPKVTKKQSSVVPPKPVYNKNLFNSKKDSTKIGVKNKKPSTTNQKTGTKQNGTKGKCNEDSARRLPLPCPSSHDSGIVTLSAVASLDGVQKQRNGGSGNTNKIVNELKSSALKDNRNTAALKEKRKDDQAQFCNINEEDFDNTCGQPIPLATSTQYSDKVNCTAAKRQKTIITRNKVDNSIDMETAIFDFFPHLEDSQLSDSKNENSSDDEESDHEQANEDEDEVSNENESASSSDDDNEDISDNNNSSTEQDRESNVSLSVPNKKIKNTTLSNHYALYSQMRRPKKRMDIEPLSPRSVTAAIVGISFEVKQISKALERKPSGPTSSATIDEDLWPLFTEEEVTHVELKLKDDSAFRKHLVNELRYKKRETADKMIIAIMEELISVELARCFSGKGRSRKGNGKKSFCSLRLYSYIKVAIQKEFPETPDLKIERKIGRWLTEMEDPRKDKKIQEQMIKKNVA